MRVANTAGLAVVFRNTQPSGRRYIRMDGFCSPAIISSRSWFAEMTADVLMSFATKQHSQMETMSV